MKKSFIDQVGNKIQIEFPPKNIVSLVPSQTELLFELGLDVEISGLTKFCIHPYGKLKEKTIVGGTKVFNFEKIHSLKPDLIIGNKEENYKEGIEQLRKNYPVWLSDIGDLIEAMGMIRMVGELVNKKNKAEEIIIEIETGFQNITSAIKKSVAYFIWKDPYMTIGCDTFIHDILARGGFINVFGNKQRYPVTTIEEVKKLKPELIFLSSEPFPFNGKHVAEFQKNFPHAKVIMVDGEIFSWFGSRLKYSGEYIKNLQALLF